MATSGGMESDLSTSGSGRGIIPSALLSHANNNVFSRTSGLKDVEEEEELRKAAIDNVDRLAIDKAMEELQKLPTLDRVRKVILEKHLQTHGRGIEVSKLGREDRQALVSNILPYNSDEGNERFLRHVRERIDKVGIAVPTIEVRYEGLTIEAKVHIGRRALPTLINSTLNFVEGALERIRLAPSKKRKLTILKDVSGIIRPGRMTLLLGPPNAGKTTLLLALAGRLDPELKTYGRVTYNGHDLTEFVPRRTSAYISQYDLQDGEMTVRETFDFYGRCQGVGARYDLLVELARAEKAAGITPDADVDNFMKAAALEGAGASIVTDYMLKTLGLDICADTFVGNEMRRGVSGGQRKRVTTGEMLVGPAKALFMDEISTGLDSSTTFQIVRFLRNSTHALDGTMVISLLQPAPETFELFDDIILLSEGQIVYQGPRESVLDFFRDMGFVCPERKGVADFLQEVTSKKDQEQYWHDKSKPYAYVSVATFALEFKGSEVGKRLEEEMLVPYDTNNSHRDALVKKKYALSKFDLFVACFEREVLLLQRNAFVYVFKVVQITIVATISMTVFLRTEMHHEAVADGTKYMGALFFGLINVMFNGLAELVMTIDRLPVYYKQRDLLLYPAWAFTIPNWILKIPLSVMESGIWVILSYYVVGFAPEPSRFFSQFLLFFLVHQMSLGLFRLIASLGRTMVIANTGGSFALLIVFVLGGFVLSRKNIHPWWIWGYWISPLMYSQNAVSVNEFLAPRWSEKFIQIGPTKRTIGEQILESRGMFTDKKWFWIGVVALIGYNILFNILFTLALQFLNPIGKPQAVVSEEMLEERSSTQNGTHKEQNLNNELEMVETGRPRKGMVLPFTALALTFHNVNYYVDMPPEMKRKGVNQRLQLLRNVSGVFRPGVLTALVGVSGAGKTTLMDVLAGRKTGGYIEGEISLSGYPKKQETFARIAGYCEQEDIHSPNLTVYESLKYSAWLRLSSDIDARKRKTFIDEVMNLVELSPLKDALVGLPGITGLSTEQRKRLTIAVELVANPSVIFMDEPTSGLDARAAAIVMRTVRNTVDTGRTVVCTIHQPSIDIFEAFDELLLMKRGGQVIYAGPLGRHSSELISYFEAVEGVPKIPNGYNPATWMLEVTEQSQEARLGIDFAEVYKLSPLYRRNEELILELSKPRLDEKELHFPTKFAQPFSVQCTATLWKQKKSYWRNPQYNVVRIFFTVIVAVMFGSIFWDLGQKRSNFQDLSNLMGAMYAAVLFIGINNAGSVQPVVSVERSVFYRERAAGMYSALPYAFGQVIIELPYVFVQTVVYCAVLYSMIQFEWTAVKFLCFVFFSYFTFLYFTLYGMMTVSFTPNLPVATIVSSAFYGVWNLFAGFMIQRPQIPVWWQWYYWATPVAWSIYGLITSQLGDINSTLVLADGVTTQTVKDFLKHSLGFDYDFLGWVVLAHVGFVVLFAFVFAFSIKFLNFQRR